MNRRKRRRVAASAALALLSVLLLVPAWSVVQARLAAAHDPAERGAVAGCESVNGLAIVYRVAPLGRRGALCSALLHQNSYWSYLSGRVIPAHWSRYDCAVLMPRGAPFCTEHPLSGPGDWADLAGPPATEITALLATRVR